MLKRQEGQKGKEKERKGKCSERRVSRVPFSAHSGFKSHSTPVCCMYLKLGLGDGFKRGEGRAWGRVS